MFVACPSGIDSSHIPEDAFVAQDRRTVSEGRPMRSAHLVRRSSRRLYVLKTTRHRRNAIEERLVIQPAITGRDACRSQHYTCHGVRQGAREGAVLRQTAPFEVSLRCTAIKMDSYKRCGWCSGSRKRCKVAVLRKPQETSWEVGRCKGAGPGT